MMTVVSTKIPADLPLSRDLDVWKGAANIAVHAIMYRGISVQLHTRTIPHCIGVAPDEWFYWFVVLLVGCCDYCPSGELS